MKWNQIKKVICIGLAAGIVLLSPATAFAQNGITAESLTAAALQKKNPTDILISNPFESGVTEEEYAAFEKEYEAGIKKSDAQEKDSAEAAAAKKANALNGLYGLDSVQYALMDNGNVIFSGQAGYHKKSTKQEVTQDSMYGVASVSKIFVTTAIMQLVDQGKINLDSPVTTYIPEFTMADARYQDITVRMLLNHSSGLMGATSRNWLLFADNDTYYHDHLLSSLKKQTLKADPGAFSVYCNDGFTLAEIVVERVSKETYSEYIKNHITAPLGMANTKTPLDNFHKTQLAGTYYKNALLPVENFNALGTGGVYSTAQNLCKLGSVYMDMSAGSGLLSDASRLATQESECRKGMWLPDTSGRNDYGLGWDTVSVSTLEKYGIKALEKGGDSLFYHSSLVVLPNENISMAVVTSGGASTYNAIFAENILLTYLDEKGRISLEEGNDNTIVKDTATVPAEVKATYDGYYGSLSATYRVKISDSGLTLYSVLDPSTKVQFTYNSQGKFVNKEGSSALSFQTQTNGKKYMMGEQYMDLPGIGSGYYKDYQGQKVTKNTLTGKTKTAWKARNNKAYFTLTEKYSSAMYLASAVAQGVFLPKDNSGYMNGSKIVDENHAEACLQIPVQNGRETKNYTFYKKNGIEFLKTEDGIYISEDGVKNIPSKSKFNVQISKTSGHARWFFVGSNTAGRKMTVKLPKNGSYTVYDEKGCVNYSYTSGKTTTVLPKGGIVVFAGDKNAKFTVSLSAASK